MSLTMDSSQLSLTPSQSTSCSTGGSARKAKCNNAKLAGRFFSLIIA
jgi:hypothetical protein